MVTVGRVRRDTGICVGRPSPLGNLFHIGVHGTREQVIASYRLWLESVLRGDPTPAGARARAMYWRLVARAREGDLRLLCHCAPEACHADVLADSINAYLAAGGAENVA